MDGGLTSVDTTQKRGQERSSQMYVLTLNKLIYICLGKEEARQPEAQDGFFRVRFGKRILIRLVLGLSEASIFSNYDLSGHVTLSQHTRLQLSSLLY